MKKNHSILFLFFFSVHVFAQTELVVDYKIYEPSCQLAAAKINVSGGTPPYYFLWSNGAVGDTISSLNGGLYTVHVSDSDTLTTDKDISFEVTAFNCKVTASNRFSPNGDGINDTWSLSLTDNYPNFLLQVFDRWGQLVHQQRHNYTPWDGTELGIKVSEATYYFVFFYEEGKTKNIEKGNVTIVR